MTVLSSARCAAALLLAAVVALSACAPRRLALPQGTGTPFPEYAQAFGEASAGCREARTLTAEAAVSGTVGRNKVRGHVLAGFERPGRMRLEAPAPAGPPVFLLAADSGRATLLLPRSEEFVADAPPEALLEALVGVSLRPDDLLAILRGCVVPDPAPVAGHRFEGGWVRIDLQDDSAAYLRQEGGRWRIVAGLRPLLAIEYDLAPGASEPRAVRLTASQNGGSGANLRLALSQVEVNAPIAAKAFTLAVPSRAVPITLADLKQNGPLGR